MNFKKFQLIEVAWDDSASTNGWQHFNEPDDISIRCYSVGYVMRVGKKTITIARDRDVQEKSGAWIQIPLACVYKIKKLSGGFN